MRCRGQPGLRKTLSKTNMQKDKKVPGVRVITGSGRASALGNIFHSSVNADNCFEQPAIRLVEGVPGSKANIIFQKACYKRKPLSDMWLTQDKHRHSKAYNERLAKGKQKALVWFISSRGGLADYGRKP